MRRPRWVALLLLALAIAGGFAWLGHWQLSRSVIAAETSGASTEVPVALAETAEPGSPLRDTAVGQRVTTTGTLVAANTLIVSDRVNLGTTGYWVTGMLLADPVSGEDEPRAVAVALGWAPDAAAARAAADRITAAGDSAVTVTGRLLPSQSPVAPDEDGDPHALASMSVAALVNLWSGADDNPVYAAYVVDDSAPAGLSAIDSPPPVAESTINWLNIFYAVEWVVFAGFAIFLWFRLSRDAWERECDELAEREAAATAGPSGPGGVGQGPREST